MDKLKHSMLVQIKAFDSARYCLGAYVNAAQGFQPHGQPLVSSDGKAQQEALAGWT